MKALFFSLPLHGHINPTLPLVRELVERGDRIVYYSTPAFAAKIEQAGAQYRPYRNAFLQDLQQLPERMEELSGLLMTRHGGPAARRTGRLARGKARLPDHRFGGAVGTMGREAAEGAGSHLGADARGQPACD